MKTNDHFGHIWIWDDFNHETVMITSSLWTSDPFDHGIVINMVGKGTNEYFELDHIWNRKYFDDKEHFHGKIDFFFKLQKICSRGASAARVRFSP